MATGGAENGGAGGSGTGNGDEGGPSRVPCVRGKAKVQKNAPGARTDMAWDHGVSVEGDSKKIKCKYCAKIITGGVYRFKHHLGCTRLNVVVCPAVPDDVKKKMFDTVVELQDKHLLKIDGGNNEDLDENGKRKREEEVLTAAALFKKKGPSQATINSIFKKSLREEANLEVASFLYNNAISFNVVKSEEFQRMCETIARHGVGYKPPSYHDVRVKYLKQKVEMTKKIVEEHRAVWKKVGCSIMTDGWTDTRRRTIINFLVNSPKGTVFLKSIDASNITKTADKIFKMIDEVVEEVGEENVVQVVTDNAANYKAAGALLMQKRKNLYWTPCAAHCIDLMLEDFEKKLPLHKETIASGKKIAVYIYSRTSLISLLHFFTNGGDLIRPGATRFATSYLSLGCLNDNKGALEKMFVSEQWKLSPLAKTNDGKHVENLVRDKQFWKNVLNCLRAAFPLLKVLRLVDSDENPAMGLIYEEIDQAKEKIEKAFAGVKKRYMLSFNYYSF